MRRPLLMLAAALVAASCTDRPATAPPLGAPLAQTARDLEAQTALDVVIAQLQAMAAAGSAALRDKLEDAIEKLQTARLELTKSRPDYQATVGAIEGGVGDLEAAVRDGLLSATVGGGLIDPLLASIARVLALAAIENAVARQGDPIKIAEAQEALAAGDVLAGVERFKDAANKYKDALAKAEGAGKCANCVQQRVGSAGGTVVTPQQNAGVFIPEGAIPDGVELTITIRPGGARPCIPPVDLPLFDECIEFLTDQGLFQFNTAVILGVCVELPPGFTEQQADLLQLFQWDTEEEETTVKVLPNTSAFFLPCDAEFRGSTVGSVRGLLDRLASLFRPTPLFARAVMLDAGVGGTSEAFGSKVTWGFPAKMAKLAGGGSAVPGAEVTPAPAVRVTDENGDPVKDAKVHFKVTAGGGKIIGPGGAELTEKLVLTDAGGKAEVAYKVAAGENKLEASGLGLEATPRKLGRLEKGIVEFTATAGAAVTGVIDFEALANGSSIIGQTPFGVTDQLTTLGAVFSVVSTPTATPSGTATICTDPFDPSNHVIAVAGSDPCSTASNEGLTLQIQFTAPTTTVEFDEIVPANVGSPFVTHPSGSTASATVTSFEGWRRVHWVITHTEPIAEIGVGAATGEVILVDNIKAPRPTTTVLASAVPLANVGFPAPLMATVTPTPPAGSTIEFLEGTTSLGTAPTDAAGKATLTVTLSSTVGRQLFSARFVGTATHGASTSNTVVQQKFQVFSDPASFTAALGGATTETQDFETFPVGTPVSTIISGVLSVTSSFPTLEASTSTACTRCLFGSGGTVRQAGNGQYDLEFAASRNALAFDIIAQNPATGPATIQIITGLAGLAFAKSNPNSEGTPNFFGIILTVPIISAAVLEGAEIGGTGDEEIGLDNFVVALVPFLP